MAAMILSLADLEGVGISGSSALYLLSYSSVMCDSLLLCNGPVLFLH